MRCQGCAGEQFVKAGRDRAGRQMYQCGACGRRQTERSTSAFCGYRFPDDIIALAVRWYLRFRWFRWGVLRWCNLAEESSDKTVTSARLNPQFGVKIVAWPYSRWVAECLPKTFQPSQQDPTEPSGVMWPSPGE